MSSKSNSITIKGKVVFIGDSSVGKTSIINYYNQINEEPQPTVGANSIQCNIMLNEKRVRVNIWDTAGQENYQCLVPMFARCSYVAVIVFDTTNLDSYNNISLWFKYAKFDCNVPHILLVSNKNDLDTVITAEQIHELKEKFRCPIFFTSAITGKNIENLFREIAEIVDQEDPEATAMEEQSVTFNEALQSEKKRKCC